MLLLLLEKEYPLDEVVFYDTGMEFQAIYNVRDKIRLLLQERNIRYTELHPPRPFLYDMLYRPKVKRTGETVCGDGWCGGACRWHTFIKKKVIDEYIGSGHTYIGIAADEQHRLKKIEQNKSSPLADFGLTEKDCLSYCYERGYFWEESTSNGTVRLYDILDRVSCWCCRNKNRKELFAMWKYLPEYWQKLKELQDKIDQPMKNFSNKKYGQYGDVFLMEKVFEYENIVNKR